MSLLDDVELQSLTIERMVFHIVGPRPSNFQKLEEINPGGFSEFFLDRIRSARHGNSYKFSDAASTKERLLRILINGKKFQEESEALAEDFQRAHGGSTAPGAFLVFLLSCGDRRVFALLKYDDEAVLTYELEDADEGRKKATLESLQRNFVRNPDALQKAALITLDPEPGHLSVLDRRNQSKVARYFETFLDAKREFTDDELTRRLFQATVDTILENEELVAEDVFREVKRRVYDATRSGGSVDAEGPGFLASVLGRPLKADDPLAVKFRSKLREQRIESESFSLSKTAIRKPAQIKIETAHGVRVTYANDLQGIVEVDEPNGTILIRDRIRRNDIEPDSNSRKSS